MITVKRLHPLFAAEIGGADLTLPLDDATKDAGLQVSVSTFLHRAAGVSDNQNRPRAFVILRSRTLVFRVRPPLINSYKGTTMKTQLATAGLLLGALLLPVAGYSADKAPSASPTSPKETAGPDTTKDRPAAKSGRRSAQPIDDSVITTNVKARFVKDKQVSALNIEVKTVNGVVELSGAAKSKQEAAKAVSLARKVKGVKSVKNDIQVAGSTAAGTMADKDRPAGTRADKDLPAGTRADKDRPATTGAMSDKDRPAKMGRSDQPVDDTVITTKVKGLYVKDKQVSAMNVEVKTVNGVVELSGTAKSKQEADQAASLARGVQGVKSVKNDIQVK